MLATLRHGVGSGPGTGDSQVYLLLTHYSRSRESLLKAPPHKTSSPSWKYQEPAKSDAQLKGFLNHFSGERTTDTRSDNVLGCKFTEAMPKTGMKDPHAVVLPDEAKASFLPDITASNPQKKWRKGLHLDGSTPDVFLSCCLQLSHGKSWFLITSCSEERWHQNAKF
jgi:hypothetical protein